MSEVTEKWADPTKRILYVLQLEDGCFYIGQSSVENFDRRIKKHFRGKGSAWTKAHSPVEIVEQTELYGSYRDIELSENEKTVEYMARYGIEKVRGGFFSTVDEEATRKNLQHHGYSL